MNNLNRDIGERIKGVRKLNELSGEEFAAQLGIEPALLERYERGEADIPVSILHGIAGAFGVGMTELLTGEAAKLSVYSVTRKGKGVGIQRRASYDYQSLAYNFNDRIIDPFLIVVEPKGEEVPVGTNTHTGQEFHYCLEGTALVRIDKHEVVLHEGDSVIFNSTYPHGIKALGGKSAKLLVTITL